MAVLQHLNFDVDCLIFYSKCCLSHTQTYVNSVPQDSSVGRVMRISANDIDEGENSIVRYQLEINSLDQQYFSIDKDNGFIFLNKTIDVSDSYFFCVSNVKSKEGDF